MQEVDTTLVSQMVSNPRRQISTTQGYKSSSHGMANISITEMNVLENSSMFAVSGTINLKLGFISENGPRETYFVDKLRRNDGTDVVSRHSRFWQRIVNMASNYILSMQCEMLPKLN